MWTTTANRRPVVEGPRRTGDRLLGRAPQELRTKWVLEKRALESTAGPHCTASPIPGKPSYSCDHSSAKLAKLPPSHLGECQIRNLLVLKKRLEAGCLRFGPFKDRLQQIG